MIELLTSPEAWIAFVTLSAMEIVLGIDNVIFIAIIVGRVADPQRRESLRTAGLLIALGLRLLLLLTISWMMGLTEPLVSLFGETFSGQSLILLGGGLFLIGKSAHEMHAKLEGEDAPPSTVAGASAQGTFLILVQIAVIDIVFSLDSVITAVGMAKQIPVMVAAMIVAVGVMLVSARAIGDFVERHPTVKILALSFLLLIGTLLVAEGFGQHISKGTIYFAMALALAVEGLNMRLRKKHRALHLHGPGLPTNVKPPGRP